MMRTKQNKQGGHENDFAAHSNAQRAPRQVVAFAEPGLVTANLERLGGTAESPVAGRRALAPGGTARGQRPAGLPMHAIFRGLATSRSGAAADIDTHYVFGSAILDEGILSVCLPVLFCM